VIGLQIRVLWIISIPYGAIKRNTQEAENQAKNLFQFLMVRLKVFIWMNLEHIIIRFQFLMVRLKDKVSVKTCYSATRFQFLMVRLKVSYIFSHFKDYFISIPYGAIKSIKNDVRITCWSYISIPYGAIKRK